MLWSITECSWKTIIYPRCLGWVFFLASFYKNDCLLIANYNFDFLCFLIFETKTKIFLKARWKNWNIFLNKNAEKSWLPMEIMAPVVSSQIRGVEILFHQSLTLSLKTSKFKTEVGPCLMFIKMVATRGQNPFLYW